ncbi:MAG TPA: antibiotic biosynthesis monooxygenase [Glycomyces sp.]|nr:antibiotic biosynthesis monooxygenase [Glycomyces sp.]
MADQPVMFINVLEVDPARQRELAELIVEGAETTIRHRPGFAGLTVFTSLDGTGVVSCAQWRSVDDVKATRADPAAAAHAARIAAIAQAAPAVYRLAAEVR